MWRLTNNREIYRQNENKTKTKKKNKKNINYKENVVLNRNPTKKTKVAFIIYLYLMGKGGTVEYVIRSAKVIRENGHSR